MASATLQEMLADPVTYRARVIFPADGGPRPLGELLDEWQERDYLRMDDAWRQVVGAPTKGTHRLYTRAWLERARGHSKSLDLATMILLALLASPRPLVGIAAAGDRDQAKLLRDAIAKLVLLNAAFQPLIQVDQYRVTNKLTGSSLEILSADAATSFGLTPDFIVCDEICHWSAAGAALWASLLSAAAKRAHCVLVVITNSGVIGTWQHELREKVKNDPDWYFSRLDGPQASWISQALLDEQRRLLLPVDFLRYWLNVWVSKIDAAIPPEDLAAAFMRDLPPLTGSEPDWTFAAGLDLSVSRDWSALAVVGKHNREGLRRLARLMVWKPKEGAQIDLDEVRRTVLATHREFRLCTLAIDPYQGVLMGQQLAQQRVPVQEVPFSGQNLSTMAGCFVESFRSRSIQIPAHCDVLRREISKLQLEVRSYGHRLSIDRVAGEGHGDCATALALALFAVRDAVPRPRLLMDVVSLGPRPYSYAAPSSTGLYHERAWLSQ